MNTLESKATAEFSIIIGTGINTTQPYEFAINGPNGTVLRAIMTPEEYAVLSALAKRLQ